MDIRCPQCQTLYEFDESQLDSGTATLKCRKCEHMFRLGEDATPSREDQRRWMVREPGGGEILYFSGFDRLHQWIVEGEVGQEWEISRTGNKWRRLGGVGEFRPIFQAVDNVSTIRGESTVSRSGGGGDEERPSRDTLDQFRDEADSPSPERAEPESGRRSDARSRGEENRASGTNRGAGVSVPADTVSGPTDTATETTGGRQRTHSPGAEETEVRNNGQPGQEEDAPARDGGAPESPSAPARGPAPDSGGGEPADVQLDSGRFGAGRGAEPSDRAPSEERRGAVGDRDADRSDAVPEAGAYRSGGGTGPIVAVVGLLAVGVVAGYLWMFQREMVRGWIDGAVGGQKGAATSDESAASARSGVREAANTARLQLYEARGVASGASETEARELLEVAIDRASPQLAEARGTALEEAEASADSPSGGAESGGSGGGTISLLSRANEQLQGGSSRRAKQLFQRVLDREPRSSEALTGLGWAELNSGNPAGAKRKFKDALEANPSFGDAYIGLGHAQRQLGKPRKALDAYETYLENFPGGSKSSIAEYQRDELREDLGLN